MVGFANFYLWDVNTRKERTDVVVFQGRRLHPSPTTSLQEPDKAELPATDVASLTSEQSPDPVLRAGAVTPDGAQRQGATAQVQTDLPEHFVTPDLGVLLPNAAGVLAEVKLSFPRDEAHWMDDFKQLMSYDVELDGWPSADGRVSTHDVVLITEQGRAVAVTKFFELRNGNDISFLRPFAIIACNRSDNRQPYYYFERRCGKLSNSTVDALLENGKKVPMQKLLDKYATVKLYDAKPPLPYMMDLIWTNVVIDMARECPKFSKLTKRQKLSVEVAIDDIVQRLRDGFTFRSLNANAGDGAPSIPHRGWVVDACEQMVSAGDVNGSRRAKRIFASSSASMKIPSRILWKSVPKWSNVLSCKSTRRNV